MRDISLKEMIRRLMGYAKPIWKELGISTLASLLGSLGQMGFMVFGGLWILSASGYGEVTLRNPVGMILCALLVSISRYMEGIYSHIGAYSILAQFRIQLFHRLQALSPAILVEEKIGNLLNIAIGDIETLEYFYAHTIGPMVTVVVLPLVSLGIAFSYSLWYGLVLLPVYLVVIVVIPWLSLRLGQQSGLKLRNALGALKGSLLETVYGMRDVQIFHEQEARASLLNHWNDEVNRCQHSLSLFRQAISSVPNFFVYLARIGLVFVALSWIPVSEESWIGKVVVSLVASSSFASTFSLTFVISHLVEAFAAAKRIFWIEDQIPFVQDEGQEVLKEVESISFEQVSFAYPKQNQFVLDQLDLKISAGETIGIIGESGSGKSTLVRLLMRYYDPQQGKVTINGVDIRNFSLETLHSKIALLEQETFLFDRSLEENLRIANPLAREEELLEALSLAGVADIVDQLTEGLQTSMGELEGRISGGEKQRIGLARAILKKADVLILDEPSANLDTLHERELLRTIDHVYQKKTVIIISHRYSTLIHCDRIFEFKNQNLSLVFEKRKA